MEIKINTEGYCVDCNANHNCSNCDRIKAFFYGRLLKILKKKEEINTQKKLCKRCGTNNVFKFGLCNECYTKAQLYNNW